MTFHQSDILLARRTARIILALYLFALAIGIAKGQKIDDGTIGGTGSVQDNHLARTSPDQTGTVLPGTCTASKVETFLNTTTKVRYMCGPTDNAWTPISAITHSLFLNLDYASSGHTGFASSSHAATHFEGGSDALAATVATANKVVQTGSAGTISPSFLPAMVGATVSAAGQAGAVPAPGTADTGRCLRGDGTWASCGGDGSAPTAKGGIITHDGANPTELAVGATGTVLISDPAQATGLRYANLVFPDDEAITLAANHNGTCRISEAFSFVTPNAPTCSLGAATAPMAWAGMDFPDDALTCINIGGFVPNSWSGGTTEARVKWVNVTGGWGQNSGGACVPDTEHPGGNNQQCMKLQIYTSFAADGVSAGAPPFNSLSESHVMPARSSSNIFTGTFPGLNMTGAAAKYKKVIRLCRDSRSTNASDTIDGTIRITEIAITWLKSLLYQ